MVAAGAGECRPTGEVAGGTGEAGVETGEGLVEEVETGVAEEAGDSMLLQHLYESAFYVGSISCSYLNSLVRFCVLPTINVYISYKHL